MKLFLLSLVALLGLSAVLEARPVAGVGRGVARGVAFRGLNRAGIGFGLNRFGLFGGIGVNRAVFANHVNRAFAFRRVAFVRPVSLGYGVGYSGAAFAPSYSYAPVGLAYGGYAGAALAPQLAADPCEPLAVPALAPAYSGFAALPAYGVGYGLGINRLGFNAFHGGYGGHRAVAFRRF